MFENVLNFFKGMSKKKQNENQSKDTAKERLHLVLMQDRANVSADFLELMKQEIIEVIKKYVEVDEKSIDVRLTNKSNDDGTNGAPALYANIPIVNIRNDMKKEIMKEEKKEDENITEKKEEESEKKEEHNEKQDENKEKTSQVENKDVENIKEEKNEDNQNKEEFKEKDIKEKTENQEKKIESEAKEIKKEKIKESSKV